MSFSTVVNLYRGGNPVWTRVGEITGFFINLPPHTNVIGCTSGPSSIRADVSEYGAYLSATNYRRTQVFVMGEFEEGVLAPFITEKVRVSTHSLTPGVMASTLCNAVGRNLGVM